MTVAQGGATGHRHSTLPLFAVALAVFAWGFGPLFVKGIDASATTIVLWRVVIGSAIAVPFAYMVGGRITGRLLVIAFPVGVCFALSFMFGFASFQETSIVNATLIPALQPVLVLLIATRFLGERRAKSELAFAAVAIVGVVIVVTGASADGSSLAGNILAVLNLVVFTGYFMLGKRVRDANVHAWSLLAAVFLDACIVVVPWALLTSNDLGAIHGTDWLLLLGLVLFPGMVGHGLMTWAHHFVDVTITSMMTLANPVVSIIGAWFLFDEHLTTVQLLGGVLVLVALGAILRHQRAERALAAEAALTGDLLDE
jgi:drug/metabolite transporter (DMT)-like permease